MSDGVREWLHGRHDCLRREGAGATLRNLELIGEAASRVPDDVRQAHPEVPWRRVIATRNRLIHAYIGIDNDTLWSIVVTDVPALLPMLRAVRLRSP